MVYASQGNAALLEALAINHKIAIFFVIAEFLVEKLYHDFTLFFTQVLTSSIAVQLNLVVKALIFIVTDWV